VGEIFIRDATEDDFGALAEIFRRASLSNESDRAALLAHPEVLRLADDLISRGRTRVAHLADGRVAGFASTRPTSSESIELDDLFVHPDFWRRGIASRLVEHVAAQARDEGATRIEVIANPHAMAFYEAVGFHVDRPAETEFGPAFRMHLDVRRVPSSLD
jgi:N-acetylglutamate synthase-like GNAT family acetyltransferase